MMRILFSIIFLFISTSAIASEIGVVDGPGGWQRDGNNIRVQNPGQDIVNIDNLEINPRGNWQTVVGEVTGIWGIHLHSVGVTSCQVFDRNGSTIRIEDCINHKQGVEYEVFKSGYPNLTSIAPPYSSTFVSISSTTVILSDTFTTDEELKTRIPLGRVQEAITGGYTIIDLRPIVSEKDRLDYTFRREMFGPAVGIDGGLVVSEVIGAPRTLSITAGKFGDERGQVHELPAFNSITGLTIWTTTPDPFPNITAVRGLLTVDNINYNNRTTGGLVAAQNNNKWIYMDFTISPAGGIIDGVDSGRVPTWLLFYGTGEFDSELEARNAPIDLSIFGNSKPKLLNLWRLILKKNSTNIESIFDLRPFFGQPAGAPAAIQATIDLQGAYDLSPNSGIPEIKTNDINEDLTLQYEGTNGKILELQKSDGTPVFTVYTSAIDGVTEDYIFVREEQPANTYGGSATVGVYVTRTLNTEVVDYGGFALLTSNRIRLEHGHYRISARLPAYSIGRHWGRLYNFSNSTTVIMGSTHYTGSGASQTDAIISGSFDVYSTEDFFIQHQTQLPLVTQGLGVSNQVEKSIFTEVELWREKRK